MRAQLRETSVAYEATTTKPFAETVQSCRAELQREGFGVLSEIDIQAKLAEKVGATLDSYLILGACHPPSAHRALLAAPEVGVLLPCDVTVSVEHGATVVRAMRPAGVMDKMPYPELAAVAEEVGAALRRVVERATA